LKSINTNVLFACLYIYLESKQCLSWYISSLACPGN